MVLEMTREVFERYKSLGTELSCGRGAGVSLVGLDGVVMEGLVADGSRGMLQNEVDEQQGDGNESVNAGKHGEDRAGELVDGGFVDVDDDGRDDERDGSFEAGQEREDLAQLSLRNDLGNQGANDDGRGGAEHRDSGSCIATNKMFSLAFTHTGKRFLYFCRTSSPLPSSS